MLVSSRASLSSQSSHLKPDSSTPHGCWWATKSSSSIQWISYLNHVDQFVWGQCGRAILILKFWFVIFFLICLFWFLCKKPIFIFSAEQGIAATTAALWLIVVPFYLFLCSGEHTSPFNIFIFSTTFVKKIFLYLKLN